MTKMCHFCGKTLPEEAEFCPSCGRPLARVIQRPEERESVPAAAQKLTCTFCGEPVPHEAAFCPGCGKRLVKSVPGAAQPASPAGARPAWQTPVRQQPRPAPKADQWITVEATNEPTRENHMSRPSQGEGHSILQMVPVSQVAAAVKTSLGGTAAAASAGEVSFGEFGEPELEAVRSVIGPIQGLFRGLGSLLGGIPRLIQNPAALAGSLALALLWFAVNQFKDWNPEVMKLLSWLTYARGGLTQGIPGMVGGTLGKGTVAAALISLFTGGLLSALKGIGVLFTGHGEKRSVPSMVIGAVVGGVLCFVFAGKLPSAETAMAGIAGAVLSLEALGSGRGKLFELVQALTSRAAEGVRTAVRGSCDGLLTGLTLGFALTTAVTAAISALL